MEETLINMYLSGYSNIDVSAESSLGDSQANGWYEFYSLFHFVLLCWKELKFVLSILINLWSPEEDRSETVENKLGSLASDNAPASLNNATSQQIEDEMQTENFTAIHESLGEGEAS